LHVIDEVSSNIPVLLESYLTKEQVTKFFEERRAFVPLEMITYEH
jgi:hypothetical protein